MNQALPAAAPALPATCEIRQSFPALERRVGENNVAYFDGPGGTQVPRTVVEAMSDYLLHHNANTHWAFPTSVETDAIIAAARSALADFLGASPSEIAFGANMTTLTFHLARALGRSYAPGDEIVVTELDHQANVAPWRALELERGVTIRVAKMIAETGQLDWDDFSRQLNGRTKLVALGAASNALGSITDVRRAAALAHSAGAQIFVDAVHYAPHALVDVRGLDCDFLSCSAYKFYGPHIGLLYGKQDLLAAIDFPKLIPSPDTAPERAETGTQNHEGIAGAAAAVDFLASLAPGPSRRARLTTAFEGLHAHGRALLAQLWDGLSAIEGVELYGPPPDAPRTPTLAFTIKGVPSLEASRRLAQRGLFVSNGDFYATTVVERLGREREGLIRAGCACYTTSEEIERLIAGVQEIASDA
ncbi:MAG TPA: cysteine desulfurase-like protein [Chthoniobacterales bacterium]|nr:cysteine desulfurase-like protein [Chthoniobacterales bacterium]